MNRLERKCLAGSLGMHVVLCATLAIGPGFVREDPVTRFEDLPLLELSTIPTKLIEEPFYGGGTPPQPAQTPQPSSPAPEPPRPKPEPEQRPEPATPPPAPKPKPDEDVLPDPAKKPAKLKEPEPKVEHRVVPNLRRVDRAQNKKPPRKSAEDAKAAAAAAAMEQAVRKARIADALSDLRGNLSGATDVGVLGPGGGEAYASYSMVIKSIYTQAWQPAPDVTDETAVVRAEITVAKNGRVVRAELTGRSSYPSLNRSVQNVLDRVRDLPPLPETVQDPERSFRLNFNLKSKRLQG